jgi:hypothetical protein
MFKSHKSLPVQTDLGKFKKALKVGDVLAYPYGKNIANINMYVEVTQEIYQQMQQLKECEYYLRGYVIVNNQRSQIGTTSQKVKEWDQLERKANFIVKQNAFQVTVTKESQRTDTIYAKVGDKIWVTEKEDAKGNSFFQLLDVEKQEYLNVGIQEDACVIDEESYKRMLTSRSILLNLK